MWRNNGGEADGGLAEGLDIDDPIARDIAQPLFSFSLHSEKFSSPSNRQRGLPFPNLRIVTKVQNYDKFIFKAYVVMDAKKRQKHNKGRKPDFQKLAILPNIAHQILIGGNSQLPFSHFPAFYAKKICTKEVLKAGGK